MDLVEEVYRATKRFPSDEQFGLVNQIRRAAVSVPANIAEGQGRLHRAEFLRFLSIARGSLAETETHLLIAVRLGYLQREDAKQAWVLLQDVGKLLNGLIKSLEGRDSTSNIRISELIETYSVDNDDRELTTDN